MPKVKNHQQKVPFLKKTTWLCLSKSYYCLGEQKQQTNFVRVGNKLFGFYVRIARFLWAKEQNSESLFTKSKSLPALFKKRATEQKAMGAFRSWAQKAVKNCQKHGENIKFVLANRAFLRAKEWKCASLLKNEQIICVTLC